MGELMGLAVGSVEADPFNFADEAPFGIDREELAAYAADKLTRRLGAIESARGADVRVIDRDVTPETLEEQFHAEDQLAAAG